MACWFLFVFLTCSFVAADQEVTVGCPGVSFHQTANYVFVRALERLNYKVTVMDQQPHRDMYPHFTAPNSSIDVVTGSDLPFNHAPWLWNYTDEFLVMGTINEATDILLGAPGYAGVTTVSDFTQNKANFPQKEILSLDTATCPQCVFMSTTVATSIGFKVRELAPEDFIAEVRKKYAQTEKFVVSWYVPTWLNKELSAEISSLRGDAAPYNRHNSGKVIVRRDRLAKFDDKARAVMGAVFVGNAAISEMDSAVNLGDKLTPSQAADKWIADNQATFDSFFSVLSEPDFPMLTVV